MRPKVDKLQRRRKLMVGFMALILISSVFAVIFFGFSSGGTTSSLKYNGLKFVRQGDTWVTNLNGVPAVFSFFPADVEFIDLSPETAGMLRDKLEIDATVDVNNTFIKDISLAVFQMKSQFGNYNVFIRNGFTTENEFNLPKITCEDATPSVPVVYFREGNETRIYRNESCVIVEADNNLDFGRAKDRLVYGAFGIIE